LLSGFDVKIQKFKLREHYQTVIQLNYLFVIQTALPATKHHDTCHHQGKGKKSLFVSWRDATTKL